MRAPKLLLCTPIFVTLLFAAPTRAALDGHSLEAVREAVESPIPVSAIEQARRLDDQILRNGTAQGLKVSLVTDEQLQHTQMIVSRVLTAIGEDPQSWVVRVLDTDPKNANAFVNGGKYIYVFTGITANVRSDSELAVIVGHEMGHSILKHNIRRNTDLTSTLANLAILVGQMKGKTNGGNAMAIGKALHSGYSRDDEREADAFGVLAAWRAGYDPLRGADFFTRLERAVDKANAEEAKQLSDFKDQALQVKAQCEAWLQQWNSGQISHTQYNANVINQRCALYRQSVASYNTQAALRANEAMQAKLVSDHPESQERIAGIAAETDWLHGARSLESMQVYPRIHTVAVALLQSHSPIFAGIVKAEGTADGASSVKSSDTAIATSANTGADTPADPTPVAKNDETGTPVKHSEDNQSAFIKQWNALDDALENGVITKAEYDRKVAAFLAKRRSD